MLFVNAELAGRLESAHAWRTVEYAYAQGELHPERGIAVEPVAGGYAIYLGGDWSAGWARGLGFAGPVAPSDIDFVECFYWNRNAAPRIDLCPLAHPSLLEILSSRAYTPDYFESMLVRSLLDENESAPRTDVRVTIAGRDDEELWLHTVAQGFDSLETPSPETLDIIRPTFHSPSAVCFLAWIGDEAAGGAAIIMHGDVAELGSDSTRAPFRGLGVQTALIHARMKAAREHGCDLAILLTSPASNSQRNAERAGLRLAYTQVSLVRKAAPRVP